MEHIQPVVGSGDRLPALFIVHNRPRFDRGKVGFHRLRIGLNQHLPSISVTGIFSKFGHAQPNGLFIIALVVGFSR
jgi:hypothetical protein